VSAQDGRDGEPAADPGEPGVEGVRHRRVHVGEVTLHVAEAGEGRPVILLHGFPELWWAWRHQLPALARAGFHAVAPDLRGYGTSDAPVEVSAYRVSRLAADVAGLARALGPGRVSVVGHDWGGVVAWAFAERHPELLDRLVVVNAPHPRAMARELRRPGQLLRSSYMLLFQLPFLPEALLAARGHLLLRRALRGLRATTPSEAELAPYVAAARRTGLRGGLGYYRAAARAALRPRRGGGGGVPRQPVARPVLVVWGERDPVLGPRLAVPPPGAALDVRVERLPGASHDAHLDDPVRVNALLVAFLSAGAAAPAMR
jgi:pimeloyl-ACP methyl ester carboxylesterase